MYLKVSYWLLIATVLLSLQLTEGSEKDDEANKENKPKLTDKMWNNLNNVYKSGAKKLNMQDYTDCPRRMMSDFHPLNMMECMDFRNIPQIKSQIELIKRHIKESANKLSKPTNVSQKKVMDAGTEIMNDSVKLARLLLNSSQECLNQMPNKVGGSYSYVRNGCKSQQK